MKTIPWSSCECILRKSTCVQVRLRVNIFSFLISPLLVHSTKAPWTSLWYRRSIFISKMRVVDQIIWSVRATHDGKSVYSIFTALINIWVSKVHALSHCNTNSWGWYCVCPISNSGSTTISSGWAGVEHFSATITTESEPMFSPNVTCIAIERLLTSSSQILSSRVKSPSSCYGLNRLLRFEPQPDS